jgi:hypothetical protein
LRERLAVGDWKDAQGFLEGLRAYELRDFFVGVLSDWSGRPPWLDAWCASSPTSPVPWLIRGVHGVRWAWEARGSTTADKVAEGAWPVFAERLLSAENDLAKAAALDALDPTPWTWLVTTARALQRDAALERERFEQARGRDPDNLSAHRHFLTALCWKWGGSHEAMFAFAREASARAPEGSRLHTLVAEAHLERWVAYGMEGPAADGAVYLRIPEVVAEVEAAWRRSAGSPRYASPVAASDHNLFAFLFWQQLQPARARRGSPSRRSRARPRPARPRQRPQRREAWPPRRPAASQKTWPRSPSRSSQRRSARSGSSSTSARRAWRCSIS